MVLFLPDHAKVKEIGNLFELCKSLVSFTCRINIAISKENNGFPAFTEEALYTCGTTGATTSVDQYLMFIHTDTVHL